MVSQCRWYVGEREIPIPPPALPRWVRLLAGLARKHHRPTRQEVADKRKLARDFTVGVTENVPSFFALVAMKHVST